MQSNILGSTPGSFKDHQFVVNNERTTNFLEGCISKMPISNILPTLFALLTNYFSMLWGLQMSRELI
jgi:hypothetical protein